MSQRPAMIGRYHVVEHLATGGMAELFLGTILGPNDFARPVVIKQILPHLARDVEFRAMFLDEARITARIRHPNVVQVEELALDGDTLFLVMEYLSGETLAALYRRLADGGRRLDPALAAYIVSEVAAGLQAAHELLDEQGVPVGLVHRDVSPDNIFVTYDGCIKVLDFGIALARGRQTRTRTGTVKGKFSYMSPEHGNGEALDPRSDLFSLGVIMHELISGGRLFKRADHLLTLKAITQDPIPRLHTLAPDCPSRLDEICARALERNRSLRFQSARAMRHELLGVLHALSPGPSPPEEHLRRLMSDAFGDRMAEKSALLRDAKMGKQKVRSADDVLAEAGTLFATASSNASDGRRRRRGRGLVVLLATLAMFGGAIWLRREPATHPGSPPQAASTPSARDVPYERVQILVHVETTPTGATVSLAGRELGVTPVDVALERGAASLALSISLAGYGAVVEPVVPDRDQRLRLTLTPLRPAVRKPALGSHRKPDAPRSNPDIPRFD